MNLVKLSAAFALAGLANTLLGPMAPLLEQRWRIGDAEVGLLFSALFLTSVSGALCVGPLSRRFGYRAVTVGGLGFTAIGTAGCAFATWPGAMFTIAVYGFGLGFALPAGNLAVAGRENAASAVVWLNWGWCLGAMVAPALTACFGMDTWWIGGAGLTACAAWLAFESSSKPGSAVRPALAPRMTVSAAAIIASLFLFIYVATEEAIGGWVASLALRSQATARFWAIAPAIFWAGVLAGRAIAATALKRRSPNTVVLAGLAIAGAGGLALILAHSAVLSLTAGAICGLGLAPIYPLVVAQYAASDRGGRSPSGAVFAAGGLGGAVGPFATGYVSQASGNLRAGLAFILPASVAMAWLQGKLAHAQKPRS